MSTLVVVILGLLLLCLSCSVESFVTKQTTSNNGRIDQQKKQQQHPRTFNPLFDVISDIDDFISDISEVVPEVKQVEVEQEEKLDGITISSTIEPNAIDNNVKQDETTTTANNNNFNRNKEFLFALGAITGRGEYATEQQKQSAISVVTKIEETFMSNDVPVDSTLLYGTWDLVFCTTELFRSSPFFMAGRSVCTTVQQIQQYNWFCTMHRNALAISTIINVRQIINQQSQQLISEFEVQVGSIPFLSDLTPFKYSGGIPLTINGAIVSTADIESISTTTSTKNDNYATTNNNNTLNLQLFMDTVEIKGSNIPGLRQLYDNNVLNKLQSRSVSDVITSNTVLNNLYTTPPKPIFRITYIDESIRISRDEDNNIFVYIKTSTNQQPTNYNTITSDLGIGKLLQGFNDAITQIYI